MIQSSYYPNLVIFNLFIVCVRVCGCARLLKKRKKKKKDAGGGRDEKTAEDKTAERKRDLWEKIWDLEMEQERAGAEGEEAHKENDSFRN